MFDIKNNIGLKIVSMVLGLLIFLFVQSLEELKESSTFDSQINIEALAPEFLVADKPESIKVKMRGPIDEVERAERLKLRPSFWINLERAQAGTDTYDVRIAIPRELRGRGLEFEWEQSAVLTIESVQMVNKAVSLETINNPPEGLEYDPATTTVEPPLVKIGGPEGLMKRIATVRVQLDLKKMQTGGTYKSKVQVMDSRGRPLDALGSLKVEPNMVTIVPVLSPALPRRNLLISANLQGRPPAGVRVKEIRISPQEVVVRGDRKALMGVTAIKTAPINLTKLNTQTTFKVSLQVPSGLRIAGSQEVTIEVIVEKLPESPSTAAPPTNP